MKKFLLSIFAVLFAFAGVWAQTWTKVTDASTLKAGDQLVIACSSKGFVASATISSNIMEKITATFSSDYATITSLPEGAAILTLGGVSGTWTLANENSKLLGATAVKKVAWGSGTTTWSISIDASGCATIQNSTSSYGRFLYNVNSPRFTTYTSNTSSSMLLPQLYRLEAAGGEGEGGETEEPVAPAKPTLTAARNFDDAMTVEITDIAEGATAYYSLNNENNWVEGTSVEITETTIVYAKVVKDELSSDVVSVTYTKNDPNAKTAIFVAADQGYDNAQEVSEIKIGDYITVSFDKGTSQNVTKYYDTGEGIRNYNGNVITFTAVKGVTINSIVFTASGASYKETPSDLTAGVSSTNDAITTISGINNSIVSFTQSDNTSRIQTIEVNYSVDESIVLVASPSLTESGEFIGSKEITITNNAVDSEATVYYTINGGNKESFTGASKALVITETTEIVAYAQIGDNVEAKSTDATANYTRIAGDPVIKFGDTASFEESITVTVETVNDAVAYYTLDGKTPTDESSVFPASLVIKATATLKVIAIEEDGYRSDVVSQKFDKSEAAVAVGGTTLVTDASTLAVGDQIIIASSAKNKVAGAITSGYMANAEATFSDDKSTITEITSNATVLTLGGTSGAWTLANENSQLLGATAVKKLAWDSGTTTWSISIDANGDATIQNGTSSYGRFLHNVNSTRFTTYTSDTSTSMLLPQIYRLEGMELEAYTLSVGTAGWATLCLNYDAEIPAGVTCYAVSAVDGEYATLAEVEGVVPANTAVIVEANAGEYVFEVATETAAVAENKLTGTTVNTYITEEAYVLSAPDGVESVGLYKAQMAGGVWLNNANKAYLPASAVLAAEGVASFSFRFEGDTTGIDEITDNRVQSTEIYDLTGRRVESITAPGIYIINGVKRIVR